jgi:hypothetical protein
MLPFIEIEATDPEVIKDQLSQAEAKLRTATALREEWSAKVERLMEVEREDGRAGKYLQARIGELTVTARELRATLHQKVRKEREACDAGSVAQELRRIDDSLALYTSAYGELVEVLQGLHSLNTLEAKVSENNAIASEGDAMALVSHIRSVIAIQSVFKEEGRVGFVGQRTQELRAIATEAWRVAQVSENTYRGARARYEKQQQQRVSTGMITSQQVRNAIPGH